LALVWNDLNLNFKIYEFWEVENGFWKIVKAYLDVGSVSCADWAGIWTLSWVAAAWRAHVA
jgi:hypothetical protein